MKQREERKQLKPLACKRIWLELCGLGSEAKKVFKTAGFNHSPIPPIPILPDFIRLRELPQLGSTGSASTTMARFQGA